MFGGILWKRQILLAYLAGRTIKYNECKEIEKIKETVGRYYFFSGNADHIESLYKYHFDKDKLQEPLPVFLPPEIPKPYFAKDSLFIVEVKEI